MKKYLDDGLAVDERRKLIGLKVDNLKAQRKTRDKGGKRKAIIKSTFYCAFRIL